MASQATAGQLDHLRQGFCGCFDGVLRKCAYQSAGQLPRSRDCLVMRANDVAGSWLTALNPIGGAMSSLPGSAAIAGYVLPMQRVSLMVGLDSDLVSVHR
jgi:hypothetical protein